MRYTDEARFLLERIEAIDADKPEKELLGVQKSLAQLVCKLAEEFDLICERIETLDEAADTISEAILDLRDKVDVKQTQNNDNGAEKDAKSLLGIDDDDDDFENYVHCPHCNTLIFVTDTDTKELSCPFCNEKFTKEDVGL